MTAVASAEARTPIDEFLAEQGSLTAVERFSAYHEADLVPASAPYYRDLIPFAQPLPGQQYAFEVDLDSCTGCKACVTACHSLNGLDEDESWRSVGLLVGTTPTAPVQMTVTTACHHCVEPACLAGCPVDAYEKDPITGIVSHLDDQCIGCGYCTLTCPYEVPVFNASRGIVRKCDMCRDRLAADEAPACVQSCPNQAITIRIVDTDTLATDVPLVPGAPSSTLTRPTTVYKTTRPDAGSMRAADHYLSRPAHGHTPLAVVLVLTQLSVGALIADLVLRFRGVAGTPQLAPAALVIGLIGLAASVSHLGRPRYAFRAVMGVRHSWLSREILAFGGYAATAALYAALCVLQPSSAWLPAAGAVAAGAGVAGVACSVMIYAVTHRRWWRLRSTAVRFGLTTAIAAVAAALAAVPSGRRTTAALLAGVVVGKLAWEASLLLHLRAGDDTDLRLTALLLTRDLAVPARWRVGLGLMGGVVLAPVFAIGAPWVWGAMALVALAAGELVERSLFFRAVTAPRMPGTLR